jgi:hypothetical protein
VTSSSYSEEYRRFFFSDIQAFIVRKTNRGAIVSWCCAGFAVLFGALGFVVVSPGALFLWTIAAITALSATVNAMFGATCSVDVQTPVARHPLAPLNRLRAAKTIFARIIPLLTAAQGELTGEQLAEITAAIETSSTA